MTEICEITQVRFTIDSESAFLHRLREVGERYDVRIICFNADLMAGKEHVKTALEHAHRSFYEQEPISNSFEMEALLYAAGSRQTQEAALFGIHTGENRCYLCICPEDNRAKDALSGLVEMVTEDWERIDEEKKVRLKRLFTITDDELEAVGANRLTELVVERVALLDVYR